MKLDMQSLTVLLIVVPLVIILVLGILSWDNDYKKKAIKWWSSLPESKRERLANSYLGCSWRNATTDEIIELYHLKYNKLN